MSYFAVLRFLLFLDSVDLAFVLVVHVCLLIPLAVLLVELLQLLRRVGVLLAVMQPVVPNGIIEDISNSVLIFDHSLCLLSLSVVALVVAVSKSIGAHQSPIQKVIVLVLLV